MACLVAAIGLAAGTAVAATSGAVSAVLTAATSGAASAAPACQVAYTVNQWSTGFTASITITNNAAAITSWTLAYFYAGNQALTEGWSGNWSQSGENVTVTNASWNGALATGASTAIGANFSYSGTNTAPAAFTLNGVACNGAAASASPSASASASPSTSPSSSPTPTPTASASPTTSPTGGSGTGGGS